MLIREVDFKYFGQEAVFRVLVNDLKKIEETGVQFEHKKFVELLPCFIC